MGVGGQCHAPATLTPRKEGLRAGLDGYGEEKISRPHRC